MPRTETDLTPNRGSAKLARPSRWAAPISVAVILLGACGADETAANQAPVVSNSIAPSGVGGNISNSSTVEPEAALSGTPEHNEDLIDAEASKVDRGLPGYATLRAQPSDLTLEILWKGTPPAEIKDMEGFSKSGVKIVIVPVPYSEAERLAAGERILKAAIAKNAEFPRPEVVTAAKNYDGLKVGFAPAAYKDLDLIAVRAKLEKIGGMPVTIVQA